MDNQKTVLGIMPNQQRDHPIFVVAGTDAFVLKKYLQIQSKLNYSGQDNRL